jgi:hypothetical protein
MSDQTSLSRETLETIETLTREISVAKKLDGEIQSELRGHIEDKIRGYMSGELRPSEADSLLLARSHFGNPQVVRSLLCEAHQQPNPGMPPLAGQLAVLAAITLIVYSLSGLLWGTVGVRWFWYPAILQAHQEHKPLNESVFHLFFLGYNIVPALVLVVVLAIARSGRRSLEWGKSGRGLHPALICFVAITLPIFCNFARQPLGELLMPAAPSVQVESANNLSIGVRASMSLIKTGFLVLPMLLWLAWIGPVRSRMHGVLWTIAAWTLMRLVMVLPAVLELAVAGRSWTAGQNTPLSPFSGVLASTLPASTGLFVVWLAVRKVSAMRRQRLAGPAE